MKGGAAMGAKVIDRSDETAGPLTQPGAIDPELEAEIAAVAALFDALPLDWQRYLDHEAEVGQAAYGRA